MTLARVLALNPKLIVADEPTSGLDPIEEILFWKPYLKVQMVRDAYW